MTSILKVDTLQDASGSGSPYIKNAVLQMPFTQYTGTTSVSVTANTNTTIDVLSVNITPKSTSSIIKLDTHIFHEWVQGNATFNSVWFFYRGSTKLAIAQAGNRLCGISMSTLCVGATDANSTPEIACYSYFDSPNTTSQVTYKVGVISYYSTSVFINRTSGDAANNTEHERGISFISATEIGG
jgi:hypothetical protein